MYTSVYVGETQEQWKSPWNGRKYHLKYLLQQQKLYVEGWGKQLLEVTRKSARDKGNVC